MTAARVALTALFGFSLGAVVAQHYAALACEARIASLPPRSVTVTPDETVYFVACPKSDKAPTADLIARGLCYEVHYP